MHSFHKKIKQKKFSALIILINVSRAANQHIKIISGESCNTEDWSNDAENSALHHRNRSEFCNT